MNPFWLFLAMLYGMVVITFWDRIIWARPEQNMPIGQWVSAISIGWLIMPPILFLMALMYMCENTLDKVIYGWQRSKG